MATALLSALELLDRAEVDDLDGCARRSFIAAIRLWPPAKQLGVAVLCEHLAGRRPFLLSDS